MIPHAIACRTCGQVHAARPIAPGTVARCVRCNSVLTRHPPDSLHRTAALALAALALYIPANAFPILRLEIHGRVSDNTVWQGASRLFHDGDYFIATIVFLASILIPLLKLIGLFILVVTTRWQSKASRPLRTTMFQFIEGIGRWAMLDVFVVAILVSLVKLQSLATILPGKGLFAFGCVVVLTLLATASYDPHLIWHQPPSGDTIGNE